MESFNFVSPINYMENKTFSTSATGTHNTTIHFLDSRETFLFFSSATYCPRNLWTTPTASHRVRERMNFDSTEHSAWPEVETNMPFISSSRLPLSAARDDSLNSRGLSVQIKQFDNKRERTWSTAEGETNILFDFEEEETSL